MVPPWPAFPRGRVRGAPSNPRRPRGRYRPLFTGMVVGAAGLLSACAPVMLGAPGAPPPARFDIDRDIFAFSNLVRAARPGQNDGFANYCLLMVRGASQFYRFARFDPSAPRVTADEYTRLARAVMAGTPWAPPRPLEARIVIPGYADLMALSRDQEPAVKAAFGSNILSMMDVRLWRVVFAASPSQQAKVAAELRAEVDAGRPVPVLLTNYPEPDLLNHAVLVYDYRDESRILEFGAYDPNDPHGRFALFFDPATRGFYVPPLTYSPPGRIRAFRLYTSPLF